jgi:small subunit ribosomal protein S16
MYRKHLSRGVAKGAMTQEEADAKYQAWIEEKESKIAKRKKATSDEIAAYHSKRSGTAKAKAKAEEPAPAETEPVSETPADTTAESGDTSSTE